LADMAPGQGGPGMDDEGGDVSQAWKVEALHGQEPDQP
jgi:hypothetical protein